MNAFLRLFGLRTNAARADQVLYWAVSVVLLVDGVGVAVATWSSSRTFVFNALNECIDPRAELPQLGEQAYRPSQQYLDCIQGPHRTAFLLGVVAASAVLLLVFAGLTVLAQCLIFGDIARLDNRPVSSRKAFNRIYRGFGVYALVLLIIVLILVGPRS